MMENIFEEIKAERKRQNEKWGEQNHPMIFFSAAKNETRLQIEEKLKEHRNNCDIKDFCTWFDILMEEIYEAFLESEPEKQREEMIQVAAVAVQIIEYLDRKYKMEATRE
jgi:hypothetical protein